MEILFWEGVRKLRVLSCVVVKLWCGQAFCEPEKVEGNGILAFARYVLFPILAGDGECHTPISIPYICIYPPSLPPDFVIERDEKFGGRVTFTTYQKLEESYAKGEIYPLDLKHGVATHLNSVGQ